MAREIKYECNKVGNFRLYNFATGSYNCICSVCGKGFLGDKRAVQCLECAIKLANKQDTKLFTEIYSANPCDYCKKNVDGYYYDNKLKNSTCHGCLEFNDFIGRKLRTL